MIMIVCFSVFTQLASQRLKQQNLFLELLLQQVCTSDCMYSRYEWVGHRPQRGSETQTSLDPPTAALHDSTHTFL